MFVGRKIGGRSAATPPVVPPPEQDSASRELPPPRVLRHGDIDLHGDLQLEHHQIKAPDFIPQPVDLLYSGGIVGAGDHGDGVLHSALRDLQNNVPTPEDLFGSTSTWLTSTPARSAFSFISASNRLTDLPTSYDTSRQNARAVPHNFRYADLRSHFSSDCTEMP